MYRPCFQTTVIQSPDDRTRTTCSCLLQPYTLVGSKESCTEPINDSDNNVLVWVYILDIYNRNYRGLDMCRSSYFKGQAKYWFHFVVFKYSCHFTLMPHSAVYQSKYTYIVRRDSRCDEMIISRGERVVHQQSVTALWKQPLHMELKLGAWGGLEVPQTGGTLCVRATEQNGAAGHHLLIAVAVLGQKR